MSEQNNGVTVIAGSVPLRTTQSFNNRLVVEAYKKEDLKTNNSSGFAMIQQKVTVKGLRVLLDAKLNDGTVILKGSTAFIKEESLHNLPWAKAILESEAVEGRFIIVDISNVEFIKPPAV